MIVKLTPKELDAAILAAASHKVPEGFTLNPTTILLVPDKKKNCSVEIELIALPGND